MTKTTSHKIPFRYKLRWFLWGFFFVPVSVERRMRDVEKCVDEILSKPK